MQSRLINLWRWGLLLALLLCWELASRLRLIDPFFFSCPSQILQTAITKWQTGSLWRDIVYTSTATIYGFLLGTAVGSILGLMFWFSKPVALVAEPWLIVLNALPKLALAPVMVILIGIGFASKVALAFLMTVAVAALSAYGGVQTLDPALQTLLTSLGATRLQIFTHLVVPSALPSIITGLRLNIALSMAGAIVGEFIASDRGLGRMIVYAGTVFDLPLVWVGVVVLCAVSMLMYAAVVFTEKLLLRAVSR